MQADSPSDGWGGHQSYSDWNLNNHDCPGSGKMAQLSSVIIPGLSQPIIPKPPVAKSVKERDMLFIVERLQNSKDPIRWISDGFNKRALATIEDVTAFTGAGVKVVKLSDAEIALLVSV
jgi:hypothetical protein